MEYPKRSMHGDAGEYLVAYRITKLLGWPCRLYGVDIGVDGEAEVMDSGGRSTGDIIKIQIKSFDSMPGGGFSVYVNDRHIGYWKKFCLPVIICAVDLRREKVYWKQVTSEEAYSTTGESKKITFDLSSDELTEDSIEALRRLVTPDESKRIESLMVDLISRSKNIEKLIFHSDPDAIEATIKVCEDILGLIEQIERIAVHFPWRLGLAGYGYLRSIRERVVKLQGQADSEYAMILNGG